VKPPIPNLYKVPPKNNEFAARIFDPDIYLRRGEEIFERDIENFVHAKRLSGGEKEIRDVLLYGVWRTGQIKTIEDV